MLRWPAFRSRVERNIVLMVLLCGVLPLAVVAIVAMREVERQTLGLAQEQLAASTQAYAQDLLDQIRYTEAEVRLLHLSGRGASDEHNVGGFSVVKPPQPLPRTVLVKGSESLLLQVPYEDLVLIGTISFDDLFEDLGQVPHGVRRCVLMNSVVVRCHGTEISADASVITALWNESFSSRYTTVIDLQIATTQLEMAALQHVSLVARILPVAILSIALIIGWFLILQIRRRMAPLTDLQEATWAVRKGNYAYQVSLHTGDEFERLGRAFNLMTARLGSSFRMMKALSKIDRLILSGSSVEDVTRHALTLARENCLSRCYVYLWDNTPSHGRLYEADGDSLTRKDLVLAPTEGDAAAIALELGGQLRQRVSETFEISRDGDACGVLFAAGNMNDGGLSDIERRTLSELADRMSVAATNADQARELYRQANYDSLTGLINRQAFTDRLKNRVEMALRQDVRGALLFIDLDRFKQVNDTEGHLTGDELLRVVAKRLEAALRSTDIVARLGGDEFAVIFPEFSSEAELTLLCERLISAVSHPIMVDRINHSVDVSVGVSIFPDDGVDSGGLLMKADVAMYKAKEHKGSAFAFFDQSLNEATEQRVKIESSLRHAIEHDELQLYFQPKLHLATGRIEQVEGLLRWPRGDDFELAPTQFIPVAEDTGLIHQFTGLLVEQSAACLELSRDRKLGIQRVAINISSQQFGRDAFADSLLEHLARVGLKTSEIELELTESILVENVELVSDELRKLRSAGVHIALDDFGTGYSSLNMLRTLPLDTLKIDRSFITPLETSLEARNVAQKIVEIARALNLEVVAEGVQTMNEVRLLRTLGCDYVQGFVLSEALPLDKLDSFITARNKARANRKVVPLQKKR